MSTYNESTSSTGGFNNGPSTLAFNNLASSPATSRSGLESDLNHHHRNIRNVTNSTCPETNVARYAESLTIPIRGTTDDDIFEIDHSVGISKDIGFFLNDTKLFDFTIKVKKTLTQVSNQAIFVSDSLAPYEEKGDGSYEIFRVHKVILAARCPYYNKQFCGGNWKESGKDFIESKFDEFEPECMKIFLQYVYTGKLKMQLRTLMGVLRIASYFLMSIVMDSCKSILDSDYFTALDLCQLYKEARCRDFDGICSFLSDLIPKRTTSESICKILKEIWTEQDPEDDSDEDICPNNKDESRSMRIRSSKSELCVKHAMSLNQETMTELLSASDDKSVNEEDEEDLPHKILRKIQSTLPELHEQEDILEDLIRLPKSALIKLFKSDRTCASEMMFFNILSKIAFMNYPVPKLYPPGLCSFKKSSVDGTQNDERHVTINELEEEKFEEEEDEEEEERELKSKITDDSKRKCYGIRFNVKSEDGKSETDDEEEKSMKLLETISERTQSVCHGDPKRYIKELIPHVRLALINRTDLITGIRESRYFTDDAIFEALIFQDVPDKIGSKSEKRFRRRGFKFDFDYVHENIEVSYDNVGKSTSTFLKRKKKTDFNQSRYVTATHSEPLPLHGIHYFEVKIYPSRNQNVTNKVFVGLCNPNDTNNLEDTFKDKNALMFYTYDLNFWSNGTQLSASYLNRCIRLRNSLDSGDVLRIAVDFRLAKSFQSFWKEMEENPSQSNEQRNILGQNQVFSIFNRNLNPPNIQNEEHGIRFRSRDNLSLILGTGNEPIFFSSPCKIYYAINNSEFSEGIDINLMSLETAPIHFAVSLLEVGQQVESSRCVYFDTIENIPNEPFLLEPTDINQRHTERMASVSHLNVANNASENLNSA